MSNSCPELRPIHIPFSAQLFPPPFPIRAGHIFGFLNLTSFPLPNRFACQGHLSDGPRSQSLPPTFIHHALEPPNPIRGEDCERGYLHSLLPPANPQELSHLVCLDGGTLTLRGVKPRHHLHTGTFEARIIQPFPFLRPLPPLPSFSAKLPSLAHANPGISPISPRANPSPSPSGPTRVTLFEFTNRPPLGSTASVFTVSRCCWTKPRCQRSTAACLAPSRRPNLLGRRPESVA
ncbi:hypothetical protein LZ31DRAFT_561048 [Colletotrichum somersetense]|nr:hypothetical protein LZ31DRAFT_561048 [Colletotrichum somersetense]